MRGDDEMRRGDETRGVEEMRGDEGTMARCMTMSIWGECEMRGDGEMGWDEGSRRDEWLVGGGE